MPLSDSRVQKFHWVHQDGSECDEFKNPASRPADLPYIPEQRHLEPMRQDQGWWCTSHQQEMVIKWEFEPRPWQGGDIVALTEIGLVVKYEYGVKSTHKWRVIMGAPDTVWYDTHQVDKYQPVLVWRDNRVAPGLQLQLDHLREMLGEVRAEAWNEGYDACREGKQRHNPHIRRRDTSISST